MLKNILAKCILSLLWTSCTFALEQEFLSTKFSNVSIRCAPNNASPVKVVLVKKNEPIKVLSTFDNWKKILDAEEDCGWVHISLLSKKRFVIVTSKESKIMYAKPVLGSRTVAKLMPGVRCRLISLQEGWCKVKIANYQGWITKNELWGI
jgi:SH3-like domain-containing protein